MKRRYMYLYQDEEPVWYLSGVEFSEFIGAYGPTNLILAKHQHGRIDYHPHTGFLVITPDEIEALCADDPYNYGDFHILDAPDLGVLDRLPKQEIAEVLYLSHKWEALSSPFLPGLGNSFAYLAHDDGWIAKVFCRAPQRFYAMFGEVLRKRLERIHRRRLPPLPHELAAALRDWTRQGLYIDLKDTAKSPEELAVNVYLLGADRAPYGPGGPATGIDHVTNNEEYWKRTSSKAVLRCRKRQWYAEVQ